jgi:hypothetical protein
VDPETYLQLLDLQHREIQPEDYEVLTRLQESAPKPHIAKDELDRFAIAYVGSRGQLIGKANASPGQLPTGSSADGFTSGLQCSVCLEEFRLGEQLRVLPCKHLFHQKCIDDWLTNANTCPVDGMAVPIDGREEDGEDTAEGDDAFTAPPHGGARQGVLAVGAGKEEGEPVNPAALALGALSR